MNTWEDVQYLMVKHQEMVEAFELSLCHKVIGMKVAESEFAIELKNGIIQLIGFDEIVIKYPRMVQNFFQERIKFTMENHTDSNERVQTQNTVYIDENPPIRIIGCTNTGGLRFWCGFTDGNSRKVLPISFAETNKIFQELVLEYLNNNVVDGTENDNFDQGVGE